MDNTVVHPPSSIVVTSEPPKTLSNKPRVTAAARRHFPRAGIKLKGWKRRKLTGRLETCVYRRYPKQNENGSWYTETEYPKGPYWDDENYKEPTIIEPINEPRGKCLFDDDSEDDNDSDKSDN